MTDYYAPHYRYCFENFRSSQLGKVFRFKALKRSRMLPVPDDMVDYVDEETMRLIEQTRIPLFLGTQFGIWPGINNVFTDDVERMIAIYSRSALSGHVSGLYFYLHTNPAHPGKKIMAFPNVPEKKASS